MDELWEATHGDQADFYKGLIQVAIALHHAGSGNLAGAEKLERGARRLLAPYLPAHRGLDLSRCLTDLRVRLRDDPSVRVRLLPPAAESERNAARD